MQAVWRVEEEWLDAHLSWNASDFAGIKAVRVPGSRVWRPDVVLLNG